METHLDSSCYCQFAGRERDEHEVNGYYAALAQLEKYASQNHPVT